MKFLNNISCILSIAALLTSCGIFVNKKTEPSLPSTTETGRPASSSFSSKSNQARNYAEKNNFSTSYCFFVDMSIHSGRKRFFVYDLDNNTVIMSGLVAHGSCQERFLDAAKFSNDPGGGCSSLGKYKIGEKYKGQYGKSYRLYGLESTNSNAYKRDVVLHGYSCVPNEEIYPRVVCNTLGCAGVSPAFFERLSSIIDKSKKPILLWIYQ